MRLPPLLVQRYNGTTAGVGYLELEVGMLVLSYKLCWQTFRYCSARASHMLDAACRFESRWGRRSGKLLTLTSWSQVQRKKRH